MDINYLLYVWFAFVLKIQNIEIYIWSYLWQSWITLQMLYLASTYTAHIQFSIKYLMSDRLSIMYPIYISLNIFGLDRPTIATKFDKCIVSYIIY